MSLTTFNSIMLLILSINNTLFFVTKEETLTKCFNALITITYLLTIIIRGLQ